MKSLLIWVLLALTLLGVLMMFVAMRANFELRTGHDRAIRSALAADADRMAWISRKGKCQ